MNSFLHNESIYLYLVYLGLLFVCLFVLLLYLPVNSYGHFGTVSSAIKPHFFMGKLEKAVNQYFVHILSLVLTTTLLEWFILWKGGELP